MLLPNLINAIKTFTKHQITKHFAQTPDDELANASALIVFTALFTKNSDVLKMVLCRTVHVNVTLMQYELQLRELPDARVCTYSETPLYIAIDHDMSLDIIKLLIEKGSIVDSLILEHAIDKNRSDIAKYLLDSNVLLKNNVVCLSDALKHEMFDVALLMINETTMNTLLYKKLPLLTMLSSFTPDYIATELIKYTKNINATSSDGDTPLHYVISFRNMYLVQLLVSNGANVNAASNNGTTPLHRITDIFSINVNNQLATFQILEFLILHGADVNAIDDGGFTPLHYAAKHGHIDLVKILLKHGADINKTYTYTTALYFAIYNNHKNVAQFLIEQGADVHIVPPNEISLLFWAIKNCSTKIVIKLLEKMNDIDINQYDTHQYTLLYYAVERSNKINLVKTLLASGADPNIKLTHSTILHEAVDKKSLEIIKLLIEANADIHGEDRYGKSVLHHVLFDIYNKEKQTKILNIFYKKE